MSMSDTAPRVRYTADGDQTDFPCPFIFFDPADLIVRLNGQRIESGFSVSGSGREGAVIFTSPPASGALVAIERRLGLRRVSDFLQSGPFSALSLNHQLDYLTACLQQLALDHLDSLHVPDPDGTPAVLPRRSERAGRLLGFDAEGRPVARESGSHEEGGGGDHPASIDAASVTAPVDGAVARSVADRLGERISVRDFGAHGDGETDDAAAFDAALTSAGQVFVPPGDYRIAGGLTLSAGRALIGAGPAARIIADTGVGRSVTLAGDGARVRGVTISGGEVGIAVAPDQPCSDTRIAEVIVDGARTGITIAGGSVTDGPSRGHAVLATSVTGWSVSGLSTRPGADGAPPEALVVDRLRLTSASEAVSGPALDLAHAGGGSLVRGLWARIVGAAPAGGAVVSVGGGVRDASLFDLHTDAVEPLDNVRIVEGAQRITIGNLIAASHGAAVDNRAGAGDVSTLDAGYPDRFRLSRARIDHLIAGRFDRQTVFVEASGPATRALDLSEGVVLASAAGGDLTLTLPAAADSPGAMLVIKRTDGEPHAVTLEASDGNHPDGAPVRLANRYDHVTVASNGAGWWIVSARRTRGDTAYYGDAGTFRPSLDQDLYLIDAWGDETEVRLPAPSAGHAVGRRVTIKKSDVSGNAVTVTDESGQGPDNHTITLSGQGHAITVMSNGAAWQVISMHP